jgi:hypothetical protein
MCKFLVVKSEGLAKSKARNFYNFEAPLENRKYMQMNISHTNKGEQDFGHSCLTTGLYS